MTIRWAEKAQGAAQVQFPRGERDPARDGGITAGTGGDLEGTDGAPLRAPKLAYAGVALFVVALTTVNALTVEHDVRGALPLWKPFVAEYTAAFVILLQLPAVALVSLRTPLGRGRWLRFGLIHLGASIAFCGVAVGGFVLLRKLIYAAVGLHYVFGSLGDLIYEYRKLVLAYCGMAVAFHLSARLVAKPQDAPAAPVPTPTPAVEVEATCDIQDGGKLIRTPVSEILTVRSAGNYVEFHLADGRRPLMRATLSSVEATLSAHGFLRTHRSWLVNPKRLRALEPEGSGDWRISLDGGAEAPLSRRFPEALEALRRA